MRLMSNSTAEGTLVRNLKTGKVFTVILDYPHKKVVQSAKGTQVFVTPEFYQFWVEVVPMIDFSTGVEYMQELH